MISLEEMEDLLDEIAAGFPREIFMELNGGILLLPETKMNPVGKNNDLYTMGAYHKGGSMGRYIVIYYGSFMKVYGRLGKESLKEKLTHTLKHEFTHHLESLAGERGLEIEDARFIAEYLGREG